VWLPAQRGPARLLLKNLRGIGKDGLLDAQADKLGPDKTNTNSPQTASNATPRCPPSVVRPEPMPNYHNSLTPTSHYVLDSVSSTVLNLRGRRGQQRHTFKSGRRQVKRVVPPKLETTQRKQATRPRSEAVASCRPPLLRWVHNRQRQPCEASQGQGVGGIKHNWKC
jgi:hypothetical protein